MYMYTEWLCHTTSVELVQTLTGRQTKNKWAGTYYSAHAHIKHYDAHVWKLLRVLLHCCCKCATVFLSENEQRRLGYSSGFVVASITNSWRALTLYSYCTARHPPCWLIDDDPSGIIGWNAIRLWLCDQSLECYCTFLSQFVCARALKSN